MKYITFIVVVNLINLFIYMIYIECKSPYEVVNISASQAINICPYDDLVKYRLYKKHNIQLKIVYNIVKLD